jgi:hypothetical protein
LEVSLALILLAVLLVVLSAVLVVLVVLLAARCKLLVEIVLFERIYIYIYIYLLAPFSSVCLPGAGCCEGQLAKGKVLSGEGWNELPI